ncbi:hypothetical protein [Thiopseudomonas denitrificans]|nr:hypothetical protein [Thiopseudomonas denitrificans]
MSFSLRLRLHYKAARAGGVKSQPGITMGRRYRRRRNNLGSVVTDVVRVASRLPWWGALLVGIFAYLVIHIGLGGYLEGQLAAQTGSQFYPILEVRNGRFIRLASWVGHACLLAGAFFAIRNHFFGANAQRTEKGIVGVVARILGRSID